MDDHPARVSLLSQTLIVRRACRELRAKDLERMEGLWADARAREKRKATKEVKEELETLGKIQDWLQSGNDVRCCLLRLRARPPACAWPRLCRGVLLPALRPAALRGEGLACPAALKLAGAASRRSWGTKVSLPVACQPQAAGQLLRLARLCTPAGSVPLQNTGSQLHPGSARCWPGRPACRL